MYGYWGKVLRVNLSNKSFIVEDVGENVWKKYVGGSGYGAKVLLEETPPKVDPFSEKNKIIFAVGLWQAAKAPGSGKWSVTTKSPLTGTFMDSSGGGNFAMAIKKTGYDAIIIEGKSNSPVILRIEDGKVKIEDASSLWGKDTAETFLELKKKNLGLK